MNKDGNEDPYFQNNMPTLKRACSPTFLTRPKFVKIGAHFSPCLSS